MKQTAVEWLIEQYTQGNYSWEAYEQAKEMEKEQIKEAYNYGQQIPPFEYAEKYYNETYGDK
jgi:hypothetical protein